MTDHEATVAVLGDLPASDTRFEGTRRRCSDLRAAEPPLLEDSGVRRRNRGSTSNDEAIVWRLSGEGRRALHRLNTTGSTK
jgi:hypothetical protein